MIRILCALIFTLHAYGIVHLADFENIAITTDLEPDDVLALKIIFAEANRLYDAKGKYPIQMIVVGEGNSTIKKLRMETLLKSYYKVPVNIPVKVGKSTLDNLFPHDGEELMGKEQLKLPVPRTEEGSEALIQFVKEAKQPLIIQLKPVQELIPLSFNKELAQKTIVIFYGSFNFRKALDDEDVVQYFRFRPEQTLPIRLQLLLDHFGQSFKKVGIIETFGVLGNQASVYHKHSWSNPVADWIHASPDPFYAMFKTLVCNWNKYKLAWQLNEMKGTFERLKHLFPEKQEVLSGLIHDLSSGGNDGLIERAEALRLELLQLNIPKAKAPEIQSIVNGSIYKTDLDLLERQINFAHMVRPSSGLQFTLSDVILALALIDPSFTAAPVKITVNEKGFIQTASDAKSTVFYYDRCEPKRFVETLLPKL
jgi:hypothetical protein